VNVLDNIEQVRVLAPEPGAWTAVVTGSNVPQGPQGYSLVGFDAKPPADVAQASAEAVGPTTVELTWIRPGDADRAGTLVVRSLAPITWTPTDGTVYAPASSPAPGVVVLAADDADHSAAPLEDFPVPPDAIIHYALFAYDGIPNYSPGVTDTAATGSAAVDAPLAARTIAAPRFFREGANPVRGPVRLAFELPAAGRVAIEAYDTAGRRVGRVVEGPQTAGLHRVTWDGHGEDGRALASGVYFLRFRTEGLTATEKVVLVR